MKKLALLLIVATVVTSVTGCGCCRRLRDWVCRGAYCGAAPTVAAPAPVAACPPVYAAPPVAMEAGCGFNPGVQTYGYGGAPMYDSGWMPGCNDCGGGSYSLPSYDQGYVTDPGVSGTIDPSPAPLAQ